MLLVSTVYMSHSNRITTQFAPKKSSVVQFDTDLATLRRQSAPFYLQWQFWWTTVPIVLTLGLAATAIAMRVTHPNAVRLCSCSAL